MHSIIIKSQLIIASIIISLICILINISSFGANLEVDFSHNWLFFLRGEIKPPDEVIIVKIDQASADFLKLDQDPELWPRSYYADMINSINKQNPALIAFNIVFDSEKHLESDQQFANSILQANNVILSSYLQKRNISSNNPVTQTSNGYSLERLTDPIEMLASAAISVAPFLIPKTSTTVKKFWTYKSIAGGISTFPATVFQCYKNQRLYSEIQQFLTHLKPELNELLPQNYDSILSSRKVNEINNLFRINFSQQEELATQLINFFDEKKISVYDMKLINAWLDYTHNNDLLFLNHYGSTGIIPSVSLYQTLTPDLLPTDFFTDKIVLVGYSEDIQPSRTLGFYTVFSNLNGIASSSIDIAATAVSNLLDNSWLKTLTLWQKNLIIISSSIVFCLIFMTLPYVMAILTALILCSFYFYFVYFIFSTQHTIYPLFIPIFIQLPLFFIFTSILTYLSNKLHQQKMHTFFASYVPDDFVDKISKTLNTSELSQIGEQTRGVCIASDVGQYTTLSETLNPIDLNKLMNDYYSIMFPIVKNKHGVVSDVIGDAMLAIWPESNVFSDWQWREHACLAALQMRSAIFHFNLDKVNHLPTRFGIHYGDIYLGNLGSKEHLEFRATGDTVNTATRIENLNKELGTHILVSSKVIDGLEQFCTRKMGIFILKGKSKAIEIYELICLDEELNADLENRISEFEAALLQFSCYEWQSAEAGFSQILLNNPKDVASDFYLEYITMNMANKEELRRLFPDQAIIKFD